MSVKRQILIVGGGYGGISCMKGLAAGLSRSTHSIALIDPNPYHAVKTRFHERAASASRELGITIPLSWLTEALEAKSVEDRVLAVDAGAMKVLGEKGEYPYDVLILAPGARAAWFGIPGAEKNALSLHNYAEASRCAEEVEKIADRSARGVAQRIIVAGAGIEGIEVAAQLAQRFRRAPVEIHIVERASEVLSASSVGIIGQRHATESLIKAGVRLHLGKAIAEVKEDMVILADQTLLPSDLVVWCSGQRAQELEGLGAQGTLAVDSTLRHRDHPSIYAIGDYAAIAGAPPEASQASAQRAVFMGAKAAENIIRAEAGQPPLPVEYRSKGEMIALGDGDGVGVFHGFHFVGVNAAALKKANETKYLATLASILPQTLRIKLFG